MCELDDGVGVGDVGVGVGVGVAVLSPGSCLSKMRGEGVNQDTGQSLRVNDIIE